MYLAHYLYVAPKGTYNELEEEPTIVSKAFVVDKLTKALNLIRDNFDGLETFDEQVDDIIETFAEGEKEYFCDDHSAGQWFRISKIGEDPVESVL